MTSPEPLRPAARWSSVVVVWVAAVVLAVLIGVFSPPADYSSGLALSLAGCIVGTLCLQLALREKTGYVDRFTGSVVGALVVFALADLVLTIAVAGSH